MLHQENFALIRDYKDVYKSSLAEELTEHYLDYEAAQVRCSDNLAATDLLPQHSPPCESGLQFFPDWSMMHDKICDYTNLVTLA